uniref:Ion transport domain-containing protein n=1 Tax=Haptolina brevifila TaxID=156173 RepID=A0A7S2IUS1_9EUKA
MVKMAEGGGRTAGAVVDTYLRADEGGDTVRPSSSISTRGSPKTSEATLAGGGAAAPRSPPKSAEGSAVTWSPESTAAAPKPQVAPPITLATRVSGTITEQSCRKVPTSTVVSNAGETSSEAQRIEQEIIVQLHAKAEIQDTQLLQSMHKRRASLRPSVAVMAATAEPSCTITEQAGRKAHAARRLSVLPAALGGRRKLNTVHAQQSSILRRASAKPGDNYYSSEEQLAHVDAIRSAWRYAAAQIIHDIRLAKRLKKQKKYGHFSIEHWGRTSRVFEKFFWFRSHVFIQLFLQGAVFCTAIYFAIVYQFGPDFLFITKNFDTALPQVILLLLLVALMLFFGLITLVPSILMQYTMVMHLSQLHQPSIVRSAMEAAKEWKPPKKKRDGPPWYVCSRERLDGVVNSQRVLMFFLVFLLLDFFVSVLDSVARSDLRKQQIEWQSIYGANVSGAILEGNSFEDESEDLRVLVQSLWYTNLIAAYIFLAEVIVRCLVAPRRYVSSPWDVFDFTIVLAYAIGFPLLTSPDETYNTSSRGMIVLLRVLRLLRFHRFIYALTASGFLTGENRRERLVNFCRSMLCIERCCQSEDERLGSGVVDDFMPPPRGAEGEGDPIAAMREANKAARIKAVADQAAAKAVSVEPSMAEAPRPKAAPELTVKEVTPPRTEPGTGAGAPAVKGSCANDTNGTSDCSA